MDKEQRALDEFGSLLIKRVRDEVIIDWDAIVEGRMKSPHAQRIHARLASLSAEELDVIRWLIPQIVDTALHHLLWTLEQVKWVTVGVRTEAGFVPNLADASDGLPGELYSAAGWIARFTTQRQFSHGEEG